MIGTIYHAGRFRVEASSIGMLPQELLYGVPPLNPLMVSAAALAFAAVWFEGIYLPARRATAVDPSRALRWE